MFQQSASSHAMRTNFVTTEQVFQKYITLPVNTQQHVSLKDRLFLYFGWIYSEFLLCIKATGMNF